jgi:hypothetical protein
MSFWDTHCQNCGRHVDGIALRRRMPWQRFVPYCRNCHRYALRRVHVITLVSLLILLIVFGAVIYGMLGR